MIFNIPAGGIKQVNVTLEGAPGEIVTYSGRTSGSVKLDDGGRGSISKLRTGAYTFKGSISGYSKTVTLKTDGTVNVWPDGRMLYWYGREVSAITVVQGGEKGTYSTTANAEKQTNRIYLRVRTRGYAGSTYYAQAVTTSAVNTGGYSRIKIVTSIQMAGENKHGITGGSKSGADVGMFSSEIDVGTTSIAVPGITANVGCSVYGTTGGDEAYHGIGVYVHAIWLE